MLWAFCVVMVSLDGNSRVEGECDHGVDLGLTNYAVGRFSFRAVY